MQRLGTIGQALYMRLFFHFANLYDGRAKGRLAFPKRYDDICNEWLGGLTVLAYKSKIEKEQLGPHLQQLVNVGFLSSYSTDKAKAGSGFVLTFRAGAAFYADYDRFYRRRMQGELQWEFQSDQKETGEPLALAYLFSSKRTGRPVREIVFAPTADKNAAKELLEHLSFDEAGDFIDYGPGRGP